MQAIRQDLRAAVSGWQTDWPTMAARLIVSALIGQGLFWRFGYDQLSIGGKSHRKMQVGFGQKVGRLAYRRLPRTRRMLYAVKALEILTDLGKCGTEGRTYRRYGLAPDAMACAVTQPLWSLIEAAEKLASMMVRRGDYQAVDEEEFVVAISCIYGSLFRYGQAAVIMALGPKLDDRLVDPLARLIRRTGFIVPVLAAAGAAMVTANVTKGYLARRLAA